VPFGKCYVPVKKVAQGISNIIPFELIEMLLIKEVISFSITNESKHKIIMPHPSFANYFKTIKIMLHTIVFIKG
jgi:hypothetical protein